MASFYVNLSHKYTQTYEAYFLVFSTICCVVAYEILRYVHIVAVRWIMSSCDTVFQDSNKSQVYVIQMPDAALNNMLYKQTTCMQKSIVKR